MTDQSDSQVSAEPGPAAAPSFGIWLRRGAFFGLTLITLVALALLLACALATDGLDPVDMLLVLLSVIVLPWSVIGFWNSAFGLLLLRFSADPERQAAPVVTALSPAAPLTARTAILVCIRNEETGRLARNLKIMLADLLRADAAGHVEFFLLSDTNQPDVAIAEARLQDELAAAYPSGPKITYRRRTDNAGFKTGNLRDFCERWGGQFDFAIVLDADSFMTADAMLRLIRILQARPEVGIVQHLAVGLPSTSGFARLFQFGMRLGMRSYTLGSAWWQADCGPFWGHNAILRLQPFIAHCNLPLLPGAPPLGGHILSHDQVEAVMMRRAGYEVRVLPREDGSWEENPTSFIEFIRRDLRWCQGNLQYFSLLFWPRLKLVSRFQLVLAILMFIGSPAWILMIVIAALKLATLDPGQSMADPLLFTSLCIIWLLMSFAPKIASALDILAAPERLSGFGGGARFLKSLAAETLFTFLVSPVMTVAHAIFMGQLLRGKGIGWTAQMRDDHSLPVSVCLRRLWPQTLAGLALAGWLLAFAPDLLLFAWPLYAGLVLAVPLAWVTALPGFGTWLRRHGIGSLPEEMTPPESLRALALPALQPLPPAE